MKKLFISFILFVFVICPFAAADRNYRNHSGAVSVGNGKKEISFDVLPTQYKDGSQWKNIDATLRDNGTYYLLDKAPYRARIPKTATGVVWFEHQNLLVKLKARNASASTGQLAANKRSVTFPDALGSGINLIYKVGRGGIRKIVEIEQAPTEDLTFDFIMTIEGGMQVIPRQALTRTLRLTPEADPNKADTCINIRPVRAWDSGGKSIKVSGDIVSDGAFTVLRKRIKVSDLSGSEQYPIYTDADADYSAGTDGTIDTNGMNSTDIWGNNWLGDSTSAITLSSYINTSTWQAQYVFMSFDTSALSGSEVINQVEIELTSSINSTDDFHLYNSTYALGSNTFTGAYTDQYTIRRGLWIGKYDSAMTANSALTKVLSSEVNGSVLSGNCVITLMTNSMAYYDGATAETVTFHSSEATTASYRPKLSVTYTEPSTGSGDPFGRGRF